MKEEVANFGLPNTVQSVSSMLELRLPSAAGGRGGVSNRRELCI